MYSDFVTEGECFSGAFAFKGNEAVIFVGVILKCAYVNKSLDGVFKFNIETKVGY